MYESIDILSLNDYFSEYNDRKPKGVYFYRINGYNECIYKFILKYFEIAEKNGIIIEHKIQNPTEKNIEYYDEILGNNFYMDKNFINSSLKKWLPEINDYKINDISNLMYDLLYDMKSEGKNINIIKNTYIKFMCWLYYKFKRILSISNGSIPKIIYQGNISLYELKFLSLINKLGFDIIMLQYNGDSEYMKLDPKSKYSKIYHCENLSEFPKNFSLSEIKNEWKKSQNVTIKNVKKNKSLIAGTNIWLCGDIFSDVLKPPNERGDDNKIYYNCFCAVFGACDMNYTSKLFDFYTNLKSTKRNILICDDMNTPSVDDISNIKRRNYTSFSDMIYDIAKNINYTLDLELLNIIKESFIYTIKYEFEKNKLSLNKVINISVYILCWLNKYIYTLFKNVDFKSIPVFIFFGDIKNETQIIFLKLISKMPVDVLIISPNSKYDISDKTIFTKYYDNYFEIKKFPIDNTFLRMGTTAYQAERELDEIMYNGSGIYRNKQHNKAYSISLNTMYEEIYILWQQDIKYRPNFDVVDDVVKLPVIYSKICGIKERNINDYWKDIKKLITNDTTVISKAPYINSSDFNPIKQYSTEFFKNGNILKQKIKSHKCYQYKFIRDEMQDYILDKLEILINSNIIKGTFQNGTELTIISTVLNMNKEILRLIQKFDFTKLNPKIIFINTTEKTYSIEDAILTAFLNIIGFDIIFFIPTGYKGVEMYFNSCEPEEHEIGEYLYDLLVPDFKKIALNNQSIFNKIFKRGV